MATGRAAPGHARQPLPGLIVMSSVVPIRPGLDGGFAVAQELTLSTRSTRDKQASFQIGRPAEPSYKALNCVAMVGHRVLLPWPGHHTWCPSAGFLVWVLFLQWSEMEPSAAAVNMLPQHLRRWTCAACWPPQYLPCAVLAPCSFILLRQFASEVPSLYMTSSCALGG